MIQRIFTNKQLSYFFQIAIIINLIGLLSDVIVYRYLPDYTILKLLNENLSNLSIFVVCFIIVSQTLFIFIQKYKQFVSSYKLAALTIELFITIFLSWLLIIDNDTQENFIIYCSSTSRTNSSYILIFGLIIIFSYLLYQFYQTLIKPDHINKTSVREMIRSVFRLVIIKYCVISIAFFGIVRLDTFHDFITDIIKHTKESIYFDATLLGLLIPTAWIITIAYYFYTNHYHKEETKEIR